MLRPRSAQSRQPDFGQPDFVAHRLCTRQGQEPVRGHPLARGCAGERRRLRAHAAATAATLHTQGTRRVPRPRPELASRHGGLRGAADGAARRRRVDRGVQVGRGAGPQPGGGGGGESGEGPEGCAGLGPDAKAAPSQGSRRGAQGGGHHMHRGEERGLYRGGGEASWLYGT